MTERWSWSAGWVERNGRIVNREVKTPEEGFEELEPLLVITVPGNVEEVPRAVNRVMEVLKDSKCVPGKEFEIEIALLEALANAVKHGCKEDPDQEVELRVLCGMDAGLVILIRDPGEGFDPGAVPSPVEEENLLRTHGRGVWLMNQMMDSVEFHEGGRLVKLHKKVPKPSED